MSQTDELSSSESASESECSSSEFEIESNNMTQPTRAEIELSLDRDFIDQLIRNENYLAQLEILSQRRSAKSLKAVGKCLIVYTN